MKDRTVESANGSVSGHGALSVYGRLGSPQAYALRDFLYRNDIPFEFVPLSSDDDARRACGVSGLADSRLPVCKFPDGSRLDCPTIAMLAEKIDRYRNPSRSEYDLAIYGAGPAGLSAAVYGASDGLKTVLIERFALGGQAGSSSMIENYMGFPAGISGTELADRARHQASKFGAEILLARQGVRGQFSPGRGIGYLDDGTQIVARASICATGVDYRKLGLPNEQRFTGAGVYYGAGASEATLLGGAPVYIVGAGNSAAQAAMHFVRHSQKVTMVIRQDTLEATVSRYLVDRIQNAPNIEILPRTEVTALAGGDVLEEIQLTNRTTNEQVTVKTSWLFICIGGVPNTEWAIEVGAVRDEGGYLVTGPDLICNGQRPHNWSIDRDPYYLETNVPGVFAAGDVRHGSVKRCAAAVGEGAMAVALVNRYLQT
jgi:thioredoxin reductase (NADPH)